MATSPNTINLSELEVPDAIRVPNTDVLFSAWLEKLRQLDPIYDALVESDPVFKQGEALTYQTTLLLQRVNDAVRAVLLASALGADLDQLGAGFNVTRLLISPAEPNAVPPVEPLFESDEAFRARIQLSWSQLNTAGARNAYRFHAKSADPDVLDAEAYGPETHGRLGEVDTYILSRTGNGIAPQALVDKVSAVLSEDETRPLTDFVTVRSATLSLFDVIAELDIPEGPDAQTVLDNAKVALTDYLEQTHRIGVVIPISGIYRALHQSGVTRVHLKSPLADLEAVAGSAPYCNSINVGIYQPPGGSDV